MNDETQEAERSWRDPFNLEQEEETPAEVAPDSETVTNVETAPQDEEAPATAPPEESTAQTDIDHRSLRSAPAPVAASLSDVRGDDDPVLGAFVEIVSGEHTGRYGVFISVDPADPKTAIVRTRDNDSVSVSTAITDLRPAKAGRR